MNCIIYAVLFLCFYANVVTVEAEPEQIKASSYLIEKWKQWYKLNDFNHDGVLSLADPVLFENYFKGLDYISDQQLKNMTKRMDWIWNTIVLNNNTDISKDDFVDMMSQRYESDKIAFFELVRMYITEWCGVIDLNKDNSLSKNELLMDMVAGGHNDITKDEDLFYSFQPRNDQIPVHKMITSFIRFATEDVESKSDIFKNALDSGV